MCVAKSLGLILHGAQPTLLHCALPGFIYEKQGSLKIDAG